MCRQRANPDAGLWQRHAECRARRLQPKTHSHVRPANPSSTRFPKRHSEIAWLRPNLRSSARNPVAPPLSNYPSVVAAPDRYAGPDARSLGAQSCRTHWAGLTKSASSARYPLPHRLVRPSPSRCVAGMKGPNPHGRRRPEPKQRPCLSPPYVAGVSILAACGVRRNHRHPGSRRSLPAFPQASCDPRSD